MENKKKLRINRESLLPNRVYSKNFVAVYGFEKTGFNIFFGLSGKSTNTVKRNRIKRIFRVLIKEKLMPYIEKEKADDFSICLISKKGIKIDDVNTELLEELKNLVKAIVNKFR